jgi:endogenous inhibitor of DNA gyrase (YacG/DUF329 family)
MRRQQIIETVECDQCGEVVDEPHSYTVEIGPAAPRGGAAIRRTIDLCPDHARAVAELHELLRRVGRVPASIQRDTSRCEICGADVPAIHIGGHIIKAHRASAPQPPTCPDCGKPYARSNAMLYHRRTAHGYDHRAALVASVAQPKRDNGR